MPDVATIPFHFLRPLWLFALLPVAAVVLLVHRRDSIAARWGGVIAPHLAEEPDRERRRGAGASAPCIWWRPD